MKIITLVSTVFISISAFGQANQNIPNNEFNAWDSNTNPQAWSTLEDVLGPGNGIVNQETGDVQNGSSALSLETPAPSGYITYTIVSLGNLWYNPSISRLVSTGTYYTSRPDSVWVLYKYLAPVSDSAGMNLTLLAADANGNPVNVLNAVFPLTPASNWSMKSFALSSRYQSGNNPDSIYVSLISSASKTKTPGARLLVDGIYFNNPVITSLDDLSDAGRDAVGIYPNPVRDGRLKFNTTKDLAGYQFELINANGQKLVGAQVVKDNTIELKPVAAGNYFWILLSPEDKIAGKGTIVIEP